MFEDDYILRAVREVAGAIARALGRSREGAHDEAEQDLDRALEELTRLPLSLLDSLDAASLLAMIGRERALATVDLLRARADVCEARGDIESAERTRLRARSLEAVL